MADNTTLPGIGDVIADEDIGGVKYQKVKLVEGTAGATTLITPLQEGTDITGATMPSGGANGRGWLSAIWKVLSDLVSISSGSADSGNPVKVGGKYNTTLPVLTSANRCDLQVDVNGKLLTTQIVNFPVSDSWTSADAVNTPLDMETGSGSTHALIQWNTSGDAPTVRFQVTQNGVDFLNVSHYFSFTAGMVEGSTISFAGNSGVLVPTYGAKYFRLLITVAKTSGTTTVEACAVTTTLPIEYTKVSGTVTVDTELPTAVAMSDTLSNPTAPSVACHETYWDEVNSVWVRKTAHNSRAIIPLASYNPGAGASTNSATYTTRTATSIVVQITPTVSGTGTLTLRLIGRACASNWVVLAQVTVPASTVRTIMFGPGCSGVGTGGSTGVDCFVAGILTRTWYVDVFHSAASAWSYVVDADYF